MRKLVYGINVTMDGNCDHTAGNPDKEVHNYFARLTREADALLYGRTTYELMVPFWPEAAKSPKDFDQSTREFAEAFVAVPQIVVFSRTLKTPKSENTVILNSNLRDEVQKLKDQPGSSILLGGVALPAELFKLGLIDEIHLMIHPIVVGKGRRLFDDLDVPVKMGFDLVNSKTFKTGFVALHYLKK